MNRCTVCGITHEEENSICKYCRNCSMPLDEAIERAEKELAGKTFYPGKRDLQVALAVLTEAARELQDLKRSRS